MIPKENQIWYLKCDQSYYKFLEVTKYYVKGKLLNTIYVGKIYNNVMTLESNGSISFPEKWKLIKDLNIKCEKCKI